MEPTMKNSVNSIYDSDEGAISTSSSEDEGSLTSELRMTHETQLSRIILSRSKLAKFVHAPFFKELAVGCFVRIGIGGKEGEPVYRIAEIGLFFLPHCPHHRITALAGVVETTKVYQLEKTRTNKGLKLKYGKDERMYRIEFVSNSNFTDKEFSHWCSTMKKQNIRMPTISCIDRKEDAIKRADSHRYTNAEIDELVKEKSRFSNDTPNFAHLKRRLLLDKEVAETEGQYQQAQEYQKKIDDLDRRAEQLKPIRVVSAVPISGVKRPQSSATKQRPIRDEPELACSDADYAPFIRKSNKMRMVCGPPKSKDVLVASPVTQKATGIRKKRPAFPDLFSEHGKIDFDIQLNVPEEISSRVPDIEIEFNKKKMDEP